jgi:hypothetical protein
MRLVLALSLAAIGVADAALAQTATPATPAPAALTPAVSAPPTDPMAIAVLDTLQTVCIPAVEGGNLDALTKSAGFKKNGDGNYVVKRQGYQMTILAPGSNPNQCHIDIVHPVDPEAPAKPLVLALHDWASVQRHWTLYRNDKSVSGAQELTTRSWETDDAGKHKALVITTFRKADGAPAKGNADTSTVIYSASAPG